MLPATKNRVLSISKTKVLFVFSVLIARCLFSLISGSIKKICAINGRVSRKSISPLSCKPGYNLNSKKYSKFGFTNFVMLGVLKEPSGSGSFKML